MTLRAQPLVFFLFCLLTTPLTGQIWDYEYGHYDINQEAKIIHSPTSLVFTNQYAFFVREHGLLQSTRTLMAFDGEQAIEVANVEGLDLHRFSLDHGAFFPWPA